MKVLIPMAGEGRRFAEAGYTFPKPLIEVNGKPMIQCVVENLGFDAEYIFLVRKEHLEKYAIRGTLEQITRGRCQIVEVDGLTDGAACTALLAGDLIDNEEELLIANSDQIVEFSRQNFEILRRFTDLDGIVFCFNAVHPKWSFVRTDDEMLVREVAEKRPISDIATCGIYYYRKGRHFVESAYCMMQKGLRVNNEYYIAPTYNEMIAAGGRIVPFFVHEMYGLGTPEDLEKFIR